MEDKKNKKIQHFSDLIAWQEAHELTLLIYKITRKFPQEELYGLVSQLRRAAISIESCIAEGFYRFHYRDRLRFYYDSRGSVGEVQSQIITAKDLKYCDMNEFKIIFDQSEKVRVILQGLITSTENLSNK